MKEWSNQDYILRHGWLLMDNTVKEELTKELKNNDEDGYAVPLAEQMIDYEQQIRKRVPSKSAIYF